MRATPDVTETEHSHMYVALNKQETEAIFSEDKDGVFIRAHLFFHTVDLDWMYHVTLLNRSVYFVHNGEEIKLRSARWTLYRNGEPPESRLEYVHYTGGDTPQLLFIEAQQVAARSKAERGPLRAAASAVLQGEASMFLVFD